MRQREDNKILCKDLDSIKDPMLREAFRNEQINLFAKRIQEEQSQGEGGSSNIFSQYFGLGGNVDDLSNY